MANRITIYGKPTDPDVKRLRREMHVLFVEHSLADPTDTRSKARLAEAGITPAKPIVEVLRSDDTGSVYLTNPDEPTLRQTLYSEGILSVTSYWV